jgi:hypothetical protein
MTEWAPAQHSSPLLDSTFPKELGRRQIILHATINTFSDQVEAISEQPQNGDESYINSVVI